MKRTMTLRVILAATLLAIAAPAIAAPSNMDQYKAQMERAQKNVNIAEVATICGLRSQRWLEVFQDGYQLPATSVQKRFIKGTFWIFIAGLLSGLQAVLMFFGWHRYPKRVR